MISVEDQVTGTGAQAHRLVFGVREEGGEWVVLRDWELLGVLSDSGSRNKVADAATAADAIAKHAPLVDDWWRRFDAVRFGRAAGMRRPVAWPEMLLLPGWIQAG